MEAARWGCHRDLLKAYDLGLRDAHVLCGLGILYYRSAISEGDTYLEEAIALKPNFPEALYTWR